MINDVVSIASKKKCSQCGMIKSLNEFHRGKGGIGGRRAECSKCHQHWQIWKRYGVDHVLYNERMGSTGGRCQICGDVTTELAYDHCHEMGAVPESFRGVLCRMHNAGISFFGDNLEGIKKAYDYLMEWECKKMLLENDGEYGVDGTLFRL
jgi:hypothetical protein